MSDVNEEPRPDCTVFSLLELAKTLPHDAETMIVDRRLTDEPAASARIFRIYRPVPPHFHQTCDEYLQILSGRARAVVGAEAPVELSPGDLLFFRRGMVHSFPEILEHPLAVFSVDTPRRNPADVIFVNPEEGSLETFLRTDS